jgi:hypothetical protein
MGVPQDRAKAVALFRQAITTADHTDLSDCARSALWAMGEQA